MRSMSALTAPIEVFYSYADADELLCIELDKHLSLLRQEGLIAPWHKRQVDPGTDWMNALDKHLNTASIILLLISADFVASDYCGTEMLRAMERHRAGDAHVIPILLRPFDWQSAPFGKLQVLPRNGKPVTSWSDRNEALADVVQSIRAMLGNTPSTIPPQAPLLSSSAKNGAVHETIDTDEMIGLFRQFLGTSTTARVLYIVGDAKLGKSHLLTKVFPVLAQQECQARHVIIDLRYPMHTIADILSLTGNQFDDLPCTHYQNAYQAWINQPKVIMEDVFLLLSSLFLATRQGQDDLHKNEHHLTTQFIKDLATYNDQQLLLLIDHVDLATEKIQAWLINNFLVQMSRLGHIRVVVAGRSLPDPHGSYAASCLRRQLDPVIDEEAYIAYCNRLEVTLVEQSIRDIARLLDYKPGMFVDHVLPKFWRPR